MPGFFARLMQAIASPKGLLAIAAVATTALPMAAHATVRQAVMPPHLRCYC
jgi:hypothetical protein